MLLEASEDPLYRTDANDLVRGCVRDLILLTVCHNRQP